MHNSREQLSGYYNTYINITHTIIFNYNVLQFPFLFSSMTNSIFTLYNIVIFITNIIVIMTSITYARIYILQLFKNTGEINEYLIC